ncbi:DUF2939 domain-containing protein [Janthinobacterium agaricidamnosum]|uniref:DUF2939 domain-containing protein n=1 Tax=Janthinobacterium agaricidamnosum NBRC 102515 = DSM 9628 TaxID=1349767 RepID=W0V500_9BURK|nr:DUF2939 domain-containing protein [Janthinobacterium agaricidamnosum]CDG82685.1 putative uncharacterized protein [Janthinobacterium agaricidamnosum NBRC 102515 = DSM 9628]
MKRSYAAAGIIAVALAGFTYVSPYVTMYRISSAAKAHDAAALSQHVDFPVLRKNLKAQLIEVMGTEMRASGLDNNPFAHLSQELAAKLLNPMIDAMVSPAGIAALIKNIPHNEPVNSAEHRVGQDVKTAAPAPRHTQKSQFSLSYRSLNEVVVRRVGSQEHAGEFTLQRSGLWSWKLTSIALPPDLLSYP